MSVPPPVTDEFWIAEFERRRIAEWTTGTCREQVVESLADILIAADQVLGALMVEEANRLLWIEPAIRQVYEQTDDLLRRFSD